MPINPTTNYDTTVIIYSHLGNKLKYFFSLTEIPPNN